MSNYSFIIHIAQALLSPYSVWMTIKDGLMTGMGILSVIGLLVIIEKLLNYFTNYKAKTE